VAPHARMRVPSGDHATCCPAYTASCSAGNLLRFSSKHRRSGGLSATPFLCMIFFFFCNLGDANTTIATISATPYGRKSFNGGQRAKRVRNRAGLEVEIGNFLHGIAIADGHVCCDRKGRKIDVERNRRQRPRQPERRQRESRLASRHHRCAHRSTRVRTGWNPGPSPTDVVSAASSGVPWLIRADDGDYTTGPIRRRGGLPGDPGYPL
jgi:hypothetical protein